MSELERDIQIVRDMARAEFNKGSVTQDRLLRVCDAASKSAQPEVRRSDEQIMELCLDIDLHAVSPPGALMLDTAAFKVREWLEKSTAALQPLKEEK